MRGTSLATALTCLILTIGGAGCIAIGGSDRYESKCPTIGKQLQDLKVARDTGAISDEEYQRTKQKLLNESHGT
jgi:hypothetical protein